MAPFSLLTKKVRIWESNDVEHLCVFVIILLFNLDEIPMNFDI
jgi:hypothetical protein